jgi:predicted permease
LASRILGKNEGEKKAFSYLFAFSNMNYFGLPVIKGVFGADVLGQFLVFTLPFTVLIHSYGWGIFASEKKFDIKKCFLSPTIIAIYVSAALGLTGLRLPDMIGGEGGVLQTAGACMSVTAMLLAGVVMGSKSLKELLFSLRPYLMELIRIVATPIIVGLPLYLLGVRGTYLFLALVVTALPAGMNVIVFPESHGHDASENSKIVFVSTLLSVVAVPVIFTLAKLLSGIA